MTSIESIRRRLRSGIPEPGDISWCRQRLQALKDWPDALDGNQAAEYLELKKWIGEYGKAK